VCVRPEIEHKIFDKVELKHSVIKFKDLLNEDTTIWQKPEN